MREDIIKQITDLKSQIREAKNCGKGAMTRKKQLLATLARALASEDSTRVRNTAHSTFRFSCKGAKPAHLEHYVDPDGSDIEDVDWRRADWG